MASLTGQNIKDTYQSLLKTSDNGLITNVSKNITDGSGSASGLYLKNNGVLLSGSIVISGSLLYSGSIVDMTVTTASYALNGESTDTGSLLVTASVSSNTITFTKGDTTTFDITVNTGSTVAAGSDTQIQYNIAGQLGGDLYFKYEYVTQSLEQGLGVVATGQYSHAEGAYTQAKGLNSHAEGSGGIASGSYSHAEGATGVAYGQYSHAEGFSAQSIGEASHAEGFATVASGDQSHAEGTQTISSGIFSHAEGASARSIGEASHAEGFNTRAVGDYSHAEGQGSIASGSFQHATGWYNLQNNTGSLFIVGIGSQNNLRKDGFTVDVDANGSGSVMIPNNANAPSVAKTGSMYVDPANNKLWIYTGNGGVGGWVTASLG